ncbi:MAG TPA: F0F1 ATP synthase subunit A [Haliangiales bacterium]|nr:F0F1 ATP synthase subunit A [Haliangiales bacterium]
MGEHSTWWDFLNGFEGWRNLTAMLEHQLGRGAGTARPWTFVMLTDTHFSLAHVLSSILVALFLVFGAFVYKGAVAGGGDKALIPPRGFTVRNVFEMMCEGILSTMEGVMGRKNAVKYLPFVGAFAFFIFFNNLLGLIPGFAPPTDTLKTNLALSVLVFVATHYLGVREHGLKYFRHFLGPVLWLSPLMLPIELVSHFARPLSLSMRLMGNMVADHKVVATFTMLVPILVPVPFMLLGLLVVIVQTLVFCLLTMVYISMAVAHEEHH